MHVQTLIRPAHPAEAEALTELALRSKSLWGYDDAFLAACRDELTVSEDECAAGAVRVAQEGGDLTGFHTVRGAPPHGELAALFVDLQAIGHGIGGLLLRDALGHARVRGFATLTLGADPGAESFYLHHGAVRIGDTPSGSIPGRMLPRLRFELGRQ